MRSGFRLRLAFALDVVGYGARTVRQEQQVERRLQRLVDVALTECGLKLDPEVVEHRWTGDGINAVLPVDIDPTVILPLLIRSLAAALGADNARSDDRIRMRMSVSAGLIERQPAGFSGQLIVDINRLVDSGALRQALADAPACDLAVAMSDHVYAMVIGPGYPGIPDGQFSPMNVVAKEFSATAWLWLSDRQWSRPAYLPLTPADPASVGGYRVHARLGGGPTGQVYLGGPAEPPGTAGPGALAGLYGLGGPSGPSGPSGLGGPGGTGGPGGLGGLGGPWGGADADGGPHREWAAVKVFGQALTADADARRRLAAGALAGSVVADPHLAPVLAADTAAARPWVVSALVRGPSLADAVTETGPLPPAAVGWTALGLARAIATLHRAGLTHRAVTPSNVLLGGHGPMLTDFGVNRAALARGPGSSAEDVFLLGCTVCFAATGRPPWSDWPAGPPGDPDLSGLPAELAPIVAGCLAHDPGARPSADHLVGWLAAAADQRPRSWLPDAVAARLRDYQELPPPRPASWPRFRRPR